MDTIKNIFVCYNHPLYGMTTEEVYQNGEYEIINWKLLNPERIHWLEVEFNDGKSRVMVLNEFVYFLRENKIKN